MSHWDEVRAQWDREGRILASRTRAASIALGVSAAMHLVNAGVSMWRPRTFDPSVTTLELGVLVVTAILFLRWLHRAVDVASTVSGKRMRWTPSRAVTSFFIPIVSLWRPYQVLRDLHDQLAPDGVPEPAPRPRLDGSGGYRDIPMDRAPPPKTLRRASIGLWWALFLVGGIHVDHTSADVGVAAFRDMLAFGGAMLAVFMLRAIDSRFAERFRRVRNASDAELESWEIRA